MKPFLSSMSISRVEIRQEASENIKMVNFEHLFRNIQNSQQFQ